MPHGTGVYPHFKAFSRPETWENLGGMKEESCLTLSLPAAERKESHPASSPGTPPFSLTSLSLHTKKEYGGLLPLTPLPPSPLGTAGSVPRPGLEDSEGKADTVENNHTSGLL